MYYIVLYSVWSLNTSITNNKKSKVLICLYFLFNSLPFSFLTGTLRTTPIHTEVKIKSQENFWTDYSTEIFWFCLQIYFPSQIWGNNGNGKKKMGENWDENRTMQKKWDLQSKMGRENLSCKLPLKIQPLFTHLCYPTERKLKEEKALECLCCGWYKKTSLAPYTKCNK